MMDITKEWLKEKGACSEGVKWFNAQKETDAVKVLSKLIKEEKLDWANWTICRIFNYKQRVQYAVFAAEQVIDIYEKKYPDNKKPREAIEAAKKCIENPSVENKKAAYAAYADDAVSAAAADAAAACAAAAAAYAASAAAATYAAYAAYVAADAARNKMKIKILNYGISLLED
jgi:hypothetical protein